ncbi:hypothetical protein AX17_005420 [Amanita inopinata Kibby_2008]|nr:hypothetical protein AX17_005420 [Amanita inopinata Kibby_2008]
MVYNASAFSTTGLSNMAHQLVISTNGVDHSVFVNFDYAIYTVEIPDGSPTSPSSPTLMPSHLLKSSPIKSSPPKQTGSGHKSRPPIGIIVGSVLGGAAFIGFILMLVFLYLHRRPRYRETTIVMTTPSPSIPDAVGFTGQPTAAHQDESVIHPLLRRDGTTHTSDQSRSTSLPHHRRLSSGAQSLSMLSHTDLSSTQGSLTPLRRDAPRRGNVNSSKTREEIREMRQMEIDQRLQSAQREMNNLTVKQSLRSSPNSPASQGATEGSGRGVAGAESESEAGAGEGMEELKEQVRSLSTQIEHLRVQQQSDWALGLSDEPPPAYSVTS